MRTKKDTYYVQTEEEMKAQLLEKGLADAVFEPGDSREIQGEEMRHLCYTLAAMEESLLALERRGINLRAHALRADRETGKLPVIHVLLGRWEYWLRGRVTLDEFLKEQETKAGGELAVDDPEAATNVESKNGEEPHVHVTELHEVRHDQLGRQRAWQDRGSISRR